MGLTAVIDKRVAAFSRGMRQRLRLFTTAQEPLPAFIGFLGFLVPLIAIALAYVLFQRHEIRA